MDGDETPTVDVDERIAQLQHALTSRIVVEQAKGVLAERYSLSPGDAFELIRLAARSNGLKVHALSDAVLAHPGSTPPQILALLSSLPRHDIAPGRAVENVFREINDAFLKLERAAWPLFICECADPSCAQAIELSPETMRTLHEDRDLYAVKHEHVDLALEAVIQRFERFVVVRKPALS